MTWYITGLQRNQRERRRTRNIIYGLRKSSKLTFVFELLFFGGIKLPITTYRLRLWLWFRCFVRDFRMPFDPSHIRSYIPSVEVYGDVWVLFWEKFIAFLIKYLLGRPHYYVFAHGELLVADRPRRRFKWNRQERMVVIISCSSSCPYSSVILRNKCGKGLILSGFSNGNNWFRNFISVLADLVSFSVVRAAVLSECWWDNLQFDGRWAVG